MFWSIYAKLRDAIICCCVAFSVTGKEQAQENKSNRDDVLHDCITYFARTSGCPWWRHQMEIFSALLAICAGNSPVTGEFPTQRPVTRSFDVSFDLRVNRRLSKQSGGWWFGTLSRPLWRHSNAIDFLQRSSLGLWKGKTSVSLKIQPYVCKNCRTKIK